VNRQSRPQPDAPSLYEADFALWAAEQAHRIRAGERAALDWDNLAEEIDSLGRSQKREVRSRLIRVIEHLLKLDHSADTPPRAGWRGTIRDQRLEIQLVLEDSPSLLPQLPTLAAQAWRLGVSAAVRDLTPAEAVAAEAAPPYTAEQLLDEDFFGRRDPSA
jgi:hypothetical protein